MVLSRELGEGWTCDLPSHKGANGFTTFTPLYGCPSVRECNWGVCQGCYQAHPDSGAAEKAGSAVIMSAVEVKEPRTPLVAATIAMDAMSFLPPPPPAPEPAVVPTCNTCSTALVKDATTVISVCGHSVCDRCMNAHLTASRQRRLDPTAVFHPASVKTSSVLSIFKFRDLPELPVPADFEFVTLPYLSDISCPCAGCQELVRERDVERLAVYNEDWNQSAMEASEHINEMRSYQTCCLSAAVCGDGPQPVSHFIQLGCNHFFHHECLAPSLRTSIEAELPSDKPRPIVCPKCHEDRNTVLCSCCGKKKHAITEQEVMGLMRFAACQFTQTDKGKWEDVTLRASFNPVPDTDDEEDEEGGFDLLSGEKRITCMCGMPYYVDVLSDVVTCTSPQCKKTICVQVRMNL